MDVETLKKTVKELVKLENWAINGGRRCAEEAK